MLVDEDSLREFVKNVAKPIAGNAKLIVGLIGECWRWFCFGDELDEAGEEADEDDVIVSVDAFRTGDVGTFRALVAAKRAAAAAANGFNVGGAVFGPVGVPGM